MSTETFITVLIEGINRNATSCAFCTHRGGGGVLPYMSYIGMCGPKGYSFSAVLVINRVSILSDFGYLVINRVWFLFSTLD